MSMTTRPSPSPAGADRPHQRRIAFMNQKGGVGKTTTTVNLAAALAEQGRRVLLIDLDPQAHATLHLGIDPGALDASVYDLLLDEDIAPAEALLHARPNLALLPAEVNLAAAENELVETPGRRHRIRRILDELGSAYDIALLDCPPSLGLLTLNALAAAREVVVPMQSHFLALQGLGKLLETVQLVAADLNPDLRVAGVILCMHDENTNHAREVVADLEQFFEAARAQESTPWSNARVFRPGVRRNIKLAECPSFGQTVFEYDSSCAGASDYRALAAALADETVFEKEGGPAPSENAAPSEEDESAPEIRTVRDRVSA